MVVSVPLQVQKAPQTLNILKIGSNCPAFPTPTPWQLLNTEKSPIGFIVNPIGFTVDLSPWSPATQSSIHQAILLWFPLPVSFLTLPRIQLKPSVFSLNPLPPPPQLCPHC